MERPPERPREPADQRDERDTTAESEETDAGGTDLMSVALLVFFVSLIAVVGAMLLLPTVV